MLTVASSKITQLSPLRVEESAVGTGGLCGSAFLNYRFEEHVKERLGTDRYIHMRNKKPKTWMMGLKYFEEFVKRNYNEEENQEVNVPFPGLPDDEEAGIDGGFMVMSSQQVKAIFDPVIDEVLKLLDGQVDAIRTKGDTVSGIILVGGFGQSNHLYNRLKSHFNTAASPAYGEKDEQQVQVQQHEHPSVEVIQPLYAWTAVVRGAVIRGLDDSMVSSRRSRLHYGTSYATVFDETKHDIADRYWSPLWERWMVSDRMQWHIAKVSNLPFDKKRKEHNELTTPASTEHSHLPRNPHLLPLHPQLHAPPIPNRNRRTNSLRFRHCTFLTHKNAFYRLHSTHGSRSRPSRTVHETENEQRSRVFEFGL
jgi:hypothetical protein